MAWAAGLGLAVDPRWDRASPPRVRTSELALVLAERLAQDLTALGFLALGAATAWEWYRRRGKAQGRLAVALVSLAIVAALGRLPAFGTVSGAAGLVVEVGTVFAVEAADHHLLLLR